MRYGEFSEKPQTGEGWINGGFFVFEPACSTIWTMIRPPLSGSRWNSWPSAGQLMAYRHDGVLAADGYAARQGVSGVPVGQRERTMEDMEVTFWQNRNVFVTGATGLLGSWLVEELLARGANVLCLVRDWVPGSRLIDSRACCARNVVRASWRTFRFCCGRSTSTRSTVSFISARRLSWARRVALAAVDLRVQYPRARGTCWKPAGPARSLIQRIVVASSDKAYGDSDRLPYTEETPLQGRFPYDVSKSCCRPDCLLLFPHLRDAGSDHPLREPVMGAEISTSAG